MYNVCTESEGIREIPATLRVVINASNNLQFMYLYL